MKLSDIALKNLLRRKGKAVFILVGLMVAVATAVAVISYIEAMTADINHKLEKYGANILVVPRTDHLALNYGGMALGGVSFEMQEIPQEALTRIRHIKNGRNIAAVGPVVLGGVTIDGQRVLLAGIDFATRQILKPWWHVLGRFPETGQIVAGSEAARVLGLSPGKAVHVKGAALAVAGILAPTGSQDDQLLFSHLGDAQQLLDKKGTVSMVEVAALCEACPIDDMVAQIGNVLPAARVMGIQQVVKGRLETLTHFRKFSYGVAAVVVLISGLVVLVTLMGSVRERTEEIGIFRAVGFRKQHVMCVVFLETLIVASLAGILGYAVGLLGAQAGLWLLADGHPVAVQVNPLLATEALAMAVGVGMAASAYPALMAARLDPNQALRAL
jgi:putative ABC transport system permease protein